MEQAEIKSTARQPMRKYVYPKAVTVGAGVPFDTALRALDRVLVICGAHGPRPDLENVGMLITFGGSSGLGLLVRETASGYTIEDIDAE